MSEEISEEAVHMAAQAWCTEETKHIEMDTRLATAFAAILQKTWMPPQCCEHVMWNEFNKVIQCHKCGDTKKPQAGAP